MNTVDLVVEEVPALFRRPVGADPLDGRVVVAATGQRAEQPRRAAHEHEGMAFVSGERGAPLACGVTRLRRGRRAPHVHAPIVHEHLDGNRMRHPVGAGRGHDGDRPVVQERFPAQGRSSVPGWYS